MFDSYREGNTLVYARIVIYTEPFQGEGKRVEFNVEISGKRLEDLIKGILFSINEGKELNVMGSFEKRAKIICLPELFGAVEVALYKMTRTYND